MTVKTIVALLLCFLCLGFGQNISAQQTFSLNEFEGTYTAGHNFGGSSITLKADGSYSRDSGSCTYTTAESGVYVVSNGLLRFTILKYTGKQNGDGKEVDLFDPQTLREFYGIRNDEKLEPLKTEFILVPVKWGGRIYLIAESALKNFTEAINFGLEPRSTLNSDPYYGSFYLREGDEQKSVSGQPSLPAEWQSFLLSAPLTAEIVAIEEQGEFQIATINRGSRDGLKVGMKLVSKDQEPSPWSEGGLILSVEEKSAKVKAFDLKTGDSLSSKYVPRNVYR